MLSENLQREFTSVFYNYFEMIVVKHVNSVTSFALTVTMQQNHWDVNLVRYRKKHDKC